MMRRPWQIWLVYALCLAIVLPAMGWLTQQTLEADRAEWQSRLAAEREEAVGSVLWQMDTELTTLLAQEAARPHFVYSPFYTAPAAVLTKTENRPDKTPATKDQPVEDWSVMQKIPSPLMTQSPPYVVLHFQINPKDQLTSPQVPTAEEAQLALKKGETAAHNVAQFSQRLNLLQQDLKFDHLVAMLPNERLPLAATGQWQINNDNVGDLQVAQASGQQVVGNTLDVPPVQQKLEDEGYTQAPNGPPAQSQSPNLNFNYANNSRSQSRLGNDLEQRNRAYQSAAQRQIYEQRLNFQSSPARLKFVSEGVSQPLWLGERLILARRVKVGEDEVIQGCWLDWPKIRSELVARYAPELPGLALEPVHLTTDRNHIKVSRLLATLPVQLSLPEGVAPLQPWSPLRAALVVAWSMLGLAAFAVALLLQGVITLSERRGAFVSAVTHELRTPLTTFRMYAEMLAANMVPSAETRQEYLETLRVEADRLSHLVENVLAYARLERGRQGERRESTSLARVIEHARPRFTDRAAQANMTLMIEVLPSAADVVARTDPAAVEQILFNLVDNACKYAADAEDRRLHLCLSMTSGHAILCVTDHGPGINAKAARRLFQPFSKSVHDAACSAPGVGLGLALSRRLARQLGGRLELEQTSGQGATFALYLPVQS
jgi:signal transduction histidine kinase